MLQELDKNFVLYSPWGNFSSLFIPNDLPASNLHNHLRITLPLLHRTEPNNNLAKPLLASPSKMSQLYNLTNHAVGWLNSHANGEY